MKNSRGFGLINMFAFMGIFIIMLIVVSLIVHNMKLDDGRHPLLNPDYQGSLYKEEKNDFDYTTIEKNLKTSATLYQRDYYPDFNDKEAKYVTSKKLIDLDYIPLLSDGKVSCKGYARISYDNVVEVKSFIKCADYYETEGYDATFAE